MDTKNIMQIMVALSYYGEKAIPGLSNNKAILAMFEKAKNGWVDKDEIAWCAAFVNAVLNDCNLPQTGKLNARSFLELGQETKSPVLGDIVVLWRVSPDSPFGHVGFFIREYNDKILILGGNQNNEVNIKAFPKSQILQYREIIIN